MTANGVDRKSDSERSIWAAGPLWTGSALGQLCAARAGTVPSQSLLQPTFAQIALRCASKLRHIGTGRYRPDKAVPGRSGVSNVQGGR